MARFTVFGSTLLNLCLGAADHPIAHRLRRPPIGLDKGNRRSMTDSNLGIPINFARNALNQYTSVDGHGALNYDGNLNVSGYDGWAFVHDAESLPLLPQ
jgi:hypothetical protein